MPIEKQPKFGLGAWGAGFDSQQDQRDNDGWRRIRRNTKHDLILRHAINKSEVSLTFEEDLMRRAALLYAGSRSDWSHRS